MHGNITGDWQVVACGQTILTFVKTGLFFDDSGKLQFDIQPERVELAEVLQFLTNLIEASGRTGGLQIVPYMRGSIPAGFAASLDLPLPDLQTGVFGISHIFAAARQRRDSWPFAQSHGAKVKAALKLRSRGFGIRRIAREVGLGVGTVMRLVEQRERGASFVNQYVRGHEMSL
jgi:hypothetical protein